MSIIPPTQHTVTTTGDRLENDLARVIAMRNLGAVTLEVIPGTRRPKAKGWDSIDSLTIDETIAILRADGNIGMRIGQPHPTQPGWVLAIVDIDRFDKEGKRKKILQLPGLPQGALRISTRYPNDDWHGHWPVYVPDNTYNSSDSDYSWGDLLTGVPKPNNRSSGARQHVIAGSVTDRYYYGAIPDKGWLPPMWTPPPKQQEPPPQEPRNRYYATRTDWITEAVQRLAAMKSGDKRNTLLNEIAYAGGYHGVHLGELKAICLEAYPPSTSKKPESAWYNTWRSGTEAGIAQALADGARQPSTNPEPNDHSESDGEQGLDLLKLVKTFAELDRTPATPAEVGRLLKLGERHQIIAHPGSGKTWGTLRLIDHYRHAVPDGVVLYIDADMKEARIGERLDILKIGKITNAYRITGMTWIELDHKHKQQLLNLITNNGQRPLLVVLDSVTFLGGGTTAEEYDQWRAAVGYDLMWQEDNDTRTLLMVDHLPKANDANKTMARGPIDKQAGADIVIAIKDWAPPLEALTLEHTKTSVGTKATLHIHKDRPGVLYDNAGNALDKQQALWVWGERPELDTLHILNGDKQQQRQDKLQAVLDTIGQLTTDDVPVTAEAIHAQLPDDNRPTLDTLRKRWLKQLTDAGKLTTTHTGRVKTWHIAEHAEDDTTTQDALVFTP